MGYKRAKKAIDLAENLLENFFGDNLVSIWSYGANVRDNYSEIGGEILLCVIVKDNIPSKLIGLNKILKKIEKAAITVPFIFTDEYIRNSLDVFPIEFFHMSLGYDLIKGKELLKGIKFEKKAMRLACERELRGKALYLRSEFIDVEDNKKKTNLLLKEAGSVFSIIFMGLLYIKDSDVPKKRSNIILTTEELYLNKKGAFSELVEFIKTDKIEDSSALLNSLAIDLDKLIEVVDKFEIK